MSATIAAEPDIAVGRLAEVRDGHIVVTVPGTDYRLHLVVSEPVRTEPGQRIEGRIRARARRVDVIGAGGRYVEPTYGRPRRIQGRIVGGDPSANTLVVNPAVPMIVSLMPNQKAEDFAVGQLVSFDIERGATFEPIQ